MCVCVCVWRSGCTATVLKGVRPRASLLTASWLVLVCVCVCVCVLVLMLAHVLVPVLVVVSILVLVLESMSVRA